MLLQRNVWILFAFLSLFAGAFMLLSNSSSDKEEVPQYLVTVIQVVEHPALDATRQGIYDELASQGFEPGKQMKWVYESAQGNVSLAAQIAQRFVGMKPDAVVALGTTVSQSACKETKETKIPVIFSSVTDPKSAKLVGDLCKPEARVTGVSNFIQLNDQFALFKKVIPSLKTLGIIYNAGEANSTALLNEIQKVAKALNIEIAVAPAQKTSEVEAAARSLIDKVDALFISNDNTALSALDAIVKVSNEAKIPLFVSDVDIVHKGALLALGPNQYELGRQTGQMVARVLRGEKIQNIPVAFPEKIELFLNLKAAQAIGLAIDDQIIQQATKVIQ